MTATREGIMIDKLTTKKSNQVNPVMKHYMLYQPWEKLTQRPFFKKRDTNIIKFTNQRFGTTPVETVKRVLGAERSSEAPQQLSRQGGATHATRQLQQAIYHSRHWN